MRLADLEVGLTYIDANVLIYAVEGRPAFVEVLTGLMQALERRSLRLVTSELTLAEVLVRPFTNNDTAADAKLKAPADLPLVLLQDLTL